MNLPKTKRIYTITDLYIFDELNRITKEIVHYLMPKFESEEQFIEINNLYCIFCDTIFNDYAELASVEIAEGRRDPICQDLQNILKLCFNKLDDINFILYAFIDSKKIGSELKNCLIVEDII